MIDVVFEYFIDEPVAYARVANFSNPLICHPEDSVGTLVDMLELSTIIPLHACRVISGEHSLSYEPGPSCLVMVRIVQTNPYKKPLLLHEPATKQFGTLLCAH